MLRSATGRLVGHRALWLTAVALSVVIVIACSADEPTPTPVPTVAPTATSVPTATPETEARPEPSGGLQEPEQEWVIRRNDEEVNLILATPDLAPGTRRFAMVLTDKSGIVAFPVVQVESFRYPDGAESLDNREGPIENTLARYFPFPYGTRGIHVTELNFDEVGTWGVEASVPRPDGSVATVEVIMEVAERTLSVDLGEIPPLSMSRTIKDVSHISELTTGSSRYDALYQTSIADALQNGKPTVVVFASPAFCTNAVCGPQVEVLNNLSNAYRGRADYIHIDLFTNPQEIQGDLSRAVPSPLLEEWGLVSQEWTFVMDGGGKVTGRFENFVPEEELEVALLSVLGAETAAEEVASDPTTAPETMLRPEEEDLEGVSPTESEAPDFVIDETTIWLDAYALLSDAEQSCIRDEVGDVALDSVLRQRVTQEGQPEEWQYAFFECLEPATLDSFFYTTTLGMVGNQMSMEGQVCVRNLIEKSDVRSVLAGERADADEEEIAAAGEYFAGMMACSLAEQVGNSETWDEDQQCLADLLETTDFAKVYVGGREGASPEDVTAAEAFMTRLFDCMSGIMEAEFQNAAGN